MAQKHAHKKSYNNDIALKLLHQILGVEHLHYGYYDKNQKATVKGIAAAQNRYMQQVLSYIPARGIKRIFDVGCGTGGISKALIKKKYDVVAIAPDPFLTDLTSKNTDGKAEVITDLYENVEHLEPGSFDLVLMSESCQYINPELGWQQNQKLLREKGYVLIADFFRIKEIDKPNISKSGHDLEDFKRVAGEHGFKLVKEKDITEQTAPTMELYQNMILTYIFPVAEALFELMRRQIPIIFKILTFFFKKKVMKLHAKYSNQGPEVWKEYKRYTIMLFQKTA